MIRIRTIRLDNLDASRHEKREEVRKDLIENNDKIKSSRGWNGHAVGPINPWNFQNVATFQANEKDLWSTAEELAKEDFVGLKGEDLNSEIWNPTSPEEILDEAAEVRSKVTRMLQQVKAFDGSSKDKDPNPTSVKIKKGGFLAPFLSIWSGGYRGIPTKFYKAEYGKSEKIEWMRTVGNHDSWYAKDLQTGDEYFYIDTGGFDGRTWIHSPDKQTLTYRDLGIEPHPLARTPELSLLPK